MSKLIIVGIFWNDLDWLSAAFKQIEYWKPDQLFLCEGCWDKKFPARSTDGTRSCLEDWARGMENTWILDNIRDGEYSENQRKQFKLVTDLANAQPDDWIMAQASDFYMFKKDIDDYREMMENEKFVFPVFRQRCFWETPYRYYVKWSRMAINLPWRLVEGFMWIPRSHLGVGGKTYNELKLKCKQMSFNTFHYEGLRDPERKSQKYSAGDRKSPEEYGNGRRMKRQKDNTVKHPEFAIPILKKKGFKV